MAFPASKDITHHSDVYPFIHPSKYAGKLSGKVVLVTGASRGIGRATALAFAAAGAHVAALARTSTDIDTLVAEIKAKYNVPAIAITGDVVDDAKKFVAEVEKSLGPIDILVNNAGITRMSLITEEKGMSSWWRVMEVNVKGPMSLILAVIPGFIARKSGIIITVGSAAAEYQVPYGSAYVASKAALLRAIANIDMELKPQGIFNYYIHPGAVNTDMVKGEGNDTMNGPIVKEIMASLIEHFVDTPQLAASTMVALAADNETRFLSGRFYDCNDDLGEIIAKKEIIEKEDLYQVKITRL